MTGTAAGAAHGPGVKGSMGLEPAAAGEYVDATVFPTAGALSGPDTGAYPARYRHEAEPLCRTRSPLPSSQAISGRARRHF
ncbi:hypothetical protein CHELA1G11_10767 [Hyphomicrobiales bacterium]|nr:hypothetical protein CHELA1G11_10767 [Hyphomicrobiales bacterium]CAH1672386.1 hypothetical protein CHELA1G2_13539 [Hyphomicrobiales bacterium]